jgi:RHS repeat-associated protein
MGIAVFVLLAGNAIAQSQPVSFPDTTTTNIQNEPGAFLAKTPEGNVLAIRSALPARIANAPELVGVVGNRDQMELYVANNPDSPYAPWIHNSLANVYRRSGRITLALSHWKTVWQQLKNSTDTDSRNEADHALAGQAELLTMLGRDGELHDLLESVNGRVISNPQDRQQLMKAREGYLTMTRNPGLNFRCGTLALAEIARMEGKPESTIDALIEESSPKEGVSLLRLAQLSRQYDLGLVPVKRTDTTPLPTPCIVHWAQNHYGALLEYNANLGSYRAIFGEPNWISAPVVDAEASGYFLVPENLKPSAWPVVSDSECSQVRGKSYIYSINDSEDKGCVIKPTDPVVRCPNCPDATGMPAWWVSEPDINVWLADEPVSYKTSRGEDFPFRITIKQRDDIGSFYAYPRPGLLHNWYSRIYIQGMPLTAPQYTTNSITHQVTTNYVSVPETNAFASWTATVDLPTGGQVTYNSSSNWSSSYDEETETTFLPSYGKLSDGTQYVVPGFPLGGTDSAPDASTFAPGDSSEEGYGYWNDGASGFRIIHPDGTVDRYGTVYWRTNASAGCYEEEALLTQHSDPIGNSDYLNYEFYTNLNSVVCFRLKQVVDYDGKTNNFIYYTSNPALLQKIVTPYNQTATFAYDTSSNLTNITDAVTNSSGITWNSDGWVSTLQTPYGTTTFNYFDADLPGTNDSPVNGDIPVDRSVTVTDPNNGTNIYAYCFSSQGAGTPSQFSSGVIPTNTPLGTLDVGTNEVGHDYAAVSFRNSFHWDSRQATSLTTTDVGSMVPSDFSKARMQHWLGDSNNVYQTDLLSVEQNASPDGTTAGQITFYDYYGKGLKYLQGTNSQVAVVARRLPSGQTYYDWKQYNSAGYVTKDISTYTLADNVSRTRTNTFIYATNTISFVLSNSMAGLPVGGPWYLNNGGYFINAYSVKQPTTPLFAVYPSSTNTCGAWSLAGLGITSISLPNLLVASIDASGASNQYSGYTQVTKTTAAYSYSTWYNLYSCFCGDYLTEEDPWNQYIVNTYTVPLPKQIINPLGYTTSITYDGNNRLTSVHSPTGLVTTNSYNTNGFLSQSIDLQIDRTNSFTYINGLIGAWVNERGLTTTYTWDNLNRLTSQSDQEGYISNVYTRLDLTASRDKLGNWTYLGYDPLQHLIAVTNANNEVTLASYCSCGALEWVRDAITNYTFFNSDLSGRVTNIDYPDGYQINSTYNSLNQLVAASDGIGYVNNTYNLQGELTSSANSVGIIQSNNYDILDRPIAITDKRGITTLLSYDSIDRVLTNIVTGISTNSFVYLTNGLAAATDGLRQNITHFQNNVLSQILYRTNANTEVTQFQYDQSGNITNLIDGKLQKTIFQYDAFNRLTNKLNNASTSVLKFTYDADGRIATRWTPQKGTTTFIRDPMGRIRTNSYPVSPQVVKAYDADGRLTNMVDGLGSTFFTYTAASQLQSEGGLWPDDTVGYTYNNQLRSGLTVGSYTALYSYDAAHRLQAIASGTGSFSYTYHPGFGGSYSSPLIQSISLPNGMSITNGYDNGGRQTATALLNSSLATVDSEGYGYNANNWRTNETRFDGSSIAYGFDHIGQLKSAKASESGGTSRLNEQFGYGYDSADNLSARTNNTLVTSFGVNSLNELSSGTPSGSLTAAGNTAQTATSVAVNGQSAAIYNDKTFATTAGLNLANGANVFTTIVQYASVAYTNLSASQLPSSTTFLYDANGNLTNDGLRSLSYDDDNHLTEVAIPGQNKSDFFYDGLGRKRVEQDYVWTGTWTQTNEIHFIYDGSVVVQERDANNNPLVTYDRGLDSSGGLQDAFGVGGLLARTDIKGTLFYHCDSLGNVAVLFDKYQTLEARYLYDPFGNVVGKWGPYADVNHYRYSSKEINQFGLYDFGGRFYDPNLQRFINCDPLGEVGGINLYGYVGNNSVNLIDPYGLSWFTDFGDWELGEANKAKQLFTGNPCDYHLDPNSLQYLSNQAGVGITPLTDKNGNYVDPTDLALDIFAQPIIALVTGGLGEIADLTDTAELSGGLGRVEEAGADVSEGGSAVVPRLPQDIAVNPTAPEALSTDRAIGQSVTQNAAAQDDIAALKAQGYTDIRVNQQQVNAAGERAGVNRPDVQATSPTGQRVYIEYDTDASTRGPDHLGRILANDPNGMVVLKNVN